MTQLRMLFHIRKDFDIPNKNKKNIRIIGKLCSFDKINDLVVVMINEGMGTGDK